ncbi:MAG: META domain-containing protein [Nostoc sp. DedQUE12a]|nr:META domain-containing protein [Nostoc sp. DedQUE12a]
MEYFYAPVSNFKTIFLTAATVPVSRAKCCKYIKKAITFALVVFGLSWALQSPSFAVGLEGNWKLTSLGDSSLPSGVEITATFDPAESAFRGKAPCNIYLTKYTSTEDKIKLTDYVVTTRAYCPYINEESKYIRAIESSNSYKVSDQELTINTDDPNAKVLKFVKPQ